MKAYAIFYEALRAGALRKASVFYSTESEINTADEFKQLVIDVSRNAVANGNANSIDDVMVLSVSLLNPTAAAEHKAEAQQRDTAHLEGQLSELHSAIMTVKNMIADPKMKQADKFNRIGEILEPY